MLFSSSNPRVFIDYFLLHHSREERYRLFISTCQDLRKALAQELGAGPVWTQEYSSRILRGNLSTNKDLDLTDPDDSLTKLLLPWFRDETFLQFIYLVQILEIKRIIDAPDIVDHSLIQKHVERRRSDNGVSSKNSFGYQVSFWRCWMYDCYRPRPEIIMTAQERSLFYNKNTDFIEKLYDFDDRVIIETAQCFALRFPQLDNKEAEQPWTIANSIAICCNDEFEGSRKFHTQRVARILLNSDLPIPRFNLDEFVLYPRRIQNDIRIALLLFRRINNLVPVSCGLFLPREIQHLILNYIFRSWIIENRDLYRYRELIRTNLLEYSGNDGSIVKELVNLSATLFRHRKSLILRSKEIWQCVKTISYPPAPPTDAQFLSYAAWILKSKPGKSLMKQILVRFLITEKKIRIAMGALLKNKYVGGEKIGNYVVGNREISRKELEPFLGVTRLTYKRSPKSKGE